jgi:uncharacterized protein (DUF1501 family)
MSDIMKGLPQVVSPFPTTRLGRQLRVIARLFLRKEQLGSKRMIFFAMLGGFDTHNSQSGSHPELLAELDGAIGAFHNEMIRQGLGRNVTLFTASEFGRTTSVNNSGTDHGWGGHHFVVGKAVKGGLVGDLPSLRPGSAQDAGQGRLIPQFAVDQFGATLASWFGVPLSELRTVFPNLKNFNSQNLGFL